MKVRQIYADCYTGGDFAWGVQPEYSSSGKGSVVQQRDIGAIDAPVWPPAGGCANNMNGTSFQMCSYRC